AGPGKQDGVLDLGPGHDDPHVDGGVGPDVRIRDSRPGADHRRPPDHGALQPSAGLDHDTTLDLRVEQLAVDPALDVLEHQPVRIEHVVELAGVLPPAADGAALDPLAAVDPLL